MTSWRTTGCTSKFPAHFPQSRDELWKNRAIICPIKSRGGPGVPPLRFKRTVLITGSVPLIRLAFGQPPTPFGLPLKGKARAGEDTRPYGTYKRLSGECRRGRRPRRPAGAHCAPLQWKTAPGRWFGDGRRGSGNASFEIFHQIRPPVGPDGTALKHS